MRTYRQIAEGMKSGSVKYNDGTLEEGFVTYERNKALELIGDLLDEVGAEFSCPKFEALAFIRFKMKPSSSGRRRREIIAESKKLLALN